MIVTLQIMKDEVGQTIDQHDGLLRRKIQQAESIVIDYLKVDADAYEDGNGLNDFPNVEAAAVIAVARMLYENPDDDPLTTGVQNLLHRLRDPAMA